MKTTSTAAARTRLGALVTSAERDGERVVLTRNGKRAAAIVSVEDLDLLDAIEAQEDAEDVTEAERVLADIAAGRTKTVPWAEAKRQLAE